MANETQDWMRGPEAARLRRELREEGKRLRDELRAEWMRAMAEQADTLRAQREEREGGGHHGGGHRGGGRGRRGGRAPLSRDAIVDVAMRIMAKDGLDKVTMRRVAHELDTGPASMYVHVSSVTELHGHMLDRIISEIDLHAGSGDWRAELTKLLRDYVDHLLEHPELARSALAMRPTGRGALQFADRIVELLADGGASPLQQGWGVDLLILWATGGAAEHAEGIPDDDSFELMRAAATNAERYPHLADIGEELFSGTGDERFDWGVDALLNGILGTPER